MHPAVPVVKISDYADSQCRRCPYRKGSSSYSVQHHGVRSQLFVNSIMNPVFKLVRILSGDERFKAIGFLPDKGAAILHDKLIPVIFSLLPRQQCRKKAAFICQLHSYGFSGIVQKKLCLPCPRIIALNQGLSANLMRPQYSMGIITFRINNFLYPRPVHQFIQFICHTLSISAQSPCA